MNSGIVIINKEQGMTSQHVVSRVKKILNVKKTGHIGTLDPLATGVLPVLIGDATKLSKYLIEHDKQYRAVIQLGQKKDTGDDEGEVIQEKNVNLLDNWKVADVLNQFIGKQMQTPPMYSAVKINGKKLYEYARQNENVEVPKREIEIYSIELIEIDNNAKQITYDVRCSKGTYIRVLCEDIAEKLNTVGYMKFLQRTAVDEFNINDAVKLEELTEKNVISVEEFYKKKKERIDLNNRKLELFLNGVMLTVDAKEGLYKIYNSNNFIGLGVVKNKLLKRDVILN